MPGFCVEEDVFPEEDPQRWKEVVDGFYEGDHRFQDRFCVTVPKRPVLMLPAVAGRNGSVSVEASWTPLEATQTLNPIVLAIVTYSSHLPGTSIKFNI